MHFRRWSGNQARSPLALFAQNNKLTQLQDLGLIRLKGLMHWMVPGIVTDICISTYLQATDLLPDYEKVGRFDGSFENWTAFRDRYIGALHGIPRIKPMKKLRRLKEAMKAHAAGLATGIIQRRVYNDAWKKLFHVYDSTYSSIRILTGTMSKRLYLELVFSTLILIWLHETSNLDLPML